MDDYKIIVEQEHSMVMAHYEVTVYSGDWYLSYNDGSCMMFDG